MQILETMSTLPAIPKTKVMLETMSTLPAIPKTNKVMLVETLVKTRTNMETPLKTGTKKETLVKTYTKIETLMKTWTCMLVTERSVPYIKRLTTLLMKPVSMMTTTTMKP
uniref:Uncharacterized protein n=1 Tax=Cacopsylla melanoneura TaxID=428564 RepID=A0A8D8XE23_9HEMI